MLLQAFSEYYLGRTAVFWETCARQGRSNVCSGWRAFRSINHQQTPENVGGNIRELIHRRTFYQLSHMFGINYGICKEILTENLNMHHVNLLQWSLPPFDQNKRRLDVCFGFREMAKDDHTFISRIIIYNEIWADVAPVTSSYSLKWNRCDNRCRRWNLNGMADGIERLSEKKALPQCFRSK